jgi:hypothetical protein
MTGSTATAGILQTVARCRRRVQVVSAARRAALAVPVAIVTVELLALILRLPAVDTVAITAAASALAVIAAAIPSIVRAPSLRETAAAIDARVQLQDRTVTALQLDGRVDPIAQLVVRDAGARLAGLIPKRAFPLEAPPYFRPVLGASGAITVAWLAIIAAPGSSWFIARDAANAAAGPGMGRSSRAVKSGANTQAAEDSSERAPSVAPGQASVRTEAKREETPVGHETTRNDADKQGRGSEGTQPTSAPSPAATPGRDTGRAAGSSDTGRGATGFAHRMASAAGGVSGGDSASIDGALNHAASAPHDAAYSDKYQVASARAEAAIAQERVPPRLRTYVRRYFVAIHP